MTIDDGIKRLASLVEERGYITKSDIDDTFPMISADELDEVYVRLRNLEIEIADQTDQNIDSGI